MSGWGLSRSDRVCEEEWDQDADGEVIRDE
jgi:hypothetical protein